MSNPLLRPNDPRFQKPELQSGPDKNPFSEGSAEVAGGLENNQPYEAGGTGDPRPYQPAYHAQQSPRAGMLMWVALGGWVAAVVGVLGLAGIITSGWITPLIGVVPAATAWLLGYEDLKAISAGAMDAAARANVRFATWVGFTGLVACLSLIGLMIYYQLGFLPDLF